MTPLPTHTNVTTPSADAGILEMGSSVSLNDELRRTIVQDVQTAEAACTQLTRDVQVEDEASMTLAQTDRQGRAELGGLRRGAVETLDMLRVNGQILQGLETTLVADVLENGEVPSLPQGAQSTPAGNRAMVAIVSPTSVSGIQHTLAGKLAQSKDLKEILETKASAVQGLVSQKSALTKSLGAVFATIQADCLEENLAKAQQHTQTARDTLQAEEDRLAKRQDTLVQIQASIARLNTDVETLTADHQSQRTATADLQIKHQKILQAQQEEHRKIQKDYDDMIKHREQLKAQMAQLQDPLQRAETMLVQRTKASRELESLRAGRSILFAEKGALEEQITALQDRRVMDERALLQAQALEAEVAGTRTENDAFDAKQVVADIQIHKYKMDVVDAQLAAVALDEGGDADLQALVTLRDAAQGKLATMVASVKRAEAEADARASALHERTRILEDHRHAFREEWDKMNAMYTAQLEENKDLERQRQESAAVVASHHKYSSIDVQEAHRLYKVHKLAKLTFQSTEENERNWAEKKKAAEKYGE